MSQYRNIVIPKEVPNSFLNKFMNNIIIPIVCKVREELAGQYDVKEGKCINYTGLCDIGCDMVKRNIEWYGALCFKNNDAMSIIEVHGEQRHTPKIHSDKWEYQHTWLVVEIGDRTIYVDPTSSQFQDLYPDIPDFYVSVKPPKWFLPDAKSLVFGRGYNINEKIKVPARVYHYKKKHYVWKRIGIFEFLVYHVWGFISDMIHPIYAARPRLHRKH